MGMHANKYEPVIIILKICVGEFLLLLNNKKEFSLQKEHPNYGTKKIKKELYD